MRRSPTQAVYSLKQGIIMQAVLATIDKDVGLIRTRLVMVLALQPSPSHFLQQRRDMGLSAVWNAANVSWQD